MRQTGLTKVINPHASKERRADGTLEFYRDDVGDDDNEYKKQSRNDTDKTKERYGIYQDIFTRQ